MSSNHQVMANSTTGSFVIHVYPATCTEDYDFVTRMCKEEPCHWANIGDKMISHTGAITNPGFFIASLNEQRIGSVCASKFGEAYNDVYCYIGLYIIDKPFRGKGYGLKLWNIMWESLEKDWNIALDAAVDMVPRYERMGLRPMWESKEFILPCSQVVATLQKVISTCDRSTALNSIKTESLHQVDFDKLSTYDTSVFGFPRQEYLQKWITIPGSLGLAVTNKDEDIIGYAVMQSSVLAKHQIIGPLFSDNNNVTRLLLSSLAKAAIDVKGAEYIRLTVPVGINPCAAEIFDNEIGYDSSTEYFRMYSKGIPPQCCITKVVALSR